MKSIRSRVRKYITPLALSVILLPILVALVKIAVCEEGVDDCVQVYAKELKEGKIKEGYVYELGSFGGATRSEATHVESGYSYKIREDYSPIPVVGRAYGCINVTDDKLVDYFNSVYCGVSYLVK